MKNNHIFTVGYGGCTVLLGLCLFWLNLFPVNFWLPLKLAVLVNIVVYLILLSRRSEKDLSILILPLGWLGLIVLFAPSFAAPAIFAVFSWCRTLVWPASPLRNVVGEVVTLAPCWFISLYFTADSFFGALLLVWLFYLCQSFYFVIIPEGRKAKSSDDYLQEFNRAHQRAERLLQAQYE